MRSADCGRAGLRTRFRFQFDKRIVLVFRRTSEEVYGHIQAACETFGARAALVVARAVSGSSIPSNQGCCCATSMLICAELHVD